jgi:hypothetical protein
MGLVNDTASVTLHLGEFVAFRTFGGKNEIPNEQSIAKMSDREKRKSLKYHFGLFLYGDARNTSIQKLAVIELKNYYLGLISSFDNKVISLSEGERFIKEYIVKTMISDSDALLEHALEENYKVLGNEKVQFLKKSFRNPVLSNYSLFERTFLPERPTNAKIAHFKEFRTFYDIKNIRGIKKVVDLDEIEARMKTKNDESNDKKFN